MARIERAILEKDTEIRRSFKYLRDSRATDRIECNAYALAIGDLHDLSDQVLLFGRDNVLSNSRPSVSRLESPRVLRHTPSS